MRSRAPPAISLIALAAIALAIDGEAVSLYGGGGAAACVPGGAALKCTATDA
jgi:hypothetical protein